MSPIRTNEYLKSEEEPNVSNQFTPNSISQQKLISDLKTPDSVAQYTHKTEKEFFQIKFEDPELDLEALYEYFEKNEEKFKQEIELKNIMVEDDSSLLIKRNCLNDYNKSMLNTNCLEEKKKEEVANQIDQMTNITLVDTLQSLIDEGELLHAYQIYLAIREKINIPDKQVRLWTHSYIELLRTNNLHKIANECVKASHINEIRNINKVSLFFLNRVKIFYFIRNQLFIFLHVEGARKL